MTGEWREWEQDLDPDAVAREAAADIKERVPLPDVGESVRVTFLEEPRKVPKERAAQEPARPLSHRGGPRPRAPDPRPGADGVIPTG